MGSDRHRTTAISWTAQVNTLIDALIDRTHREWPRAAGLLHLPSGQSIFTIRHRPDDPACSGGHLGYFTSRIAPACAVPPIPAAPGRSRPVTLEVHQHSVGAGGAVVARYRLDLRTGRLIGGATGASGSPAPAVDRESAARRAG